MRASFGALLLVELRVRQLPALRTYHRPVPKDVALPEVLIDKVEHVPLAALHEHPQNPRQGDVGAIVTSIQANGFFSPLLVQRTTDAGAVGPVCGGNHRLKAARTLKMASVPVCYLDVDDDTALRILVADNRANDLATNSDAALLELLEGLTFTERGLSGTLYDGDDLDELRKLLGEVQSTGSGDPNRVPEAPPEPVTKPGDLWLIGDHRVLCGDATKPDDYAMLLRGGSPSLLLTDPPYGVSIGAKNATLNSVGKGNPHEGELSGDAGIAEVEKLWRSAFPVMRDVLPAGCPFYVFGPQGGDLGLLLLLLLRDSGMPARHILTWVKNRASFSLGRLDYDYAHEPICYGWMPGAAHPWYAPETQSSVIEEPRPAASKLHPTMKPVGLLERLVRNSTKAHQIVLDPFGGSGSTLIAAHQHGRVGYLLEIDPHYTDVIVKRAQEFTSEVPILEATKEPYDFVEAEESVGSTL